jgi:hypothetical protein
MIAIHDLWTEAAYPPRRSVDAYWANLAVAISCMPDMQERPPLGCLLASGPICMGVCEGLIDVADRLWTAITARTARVSTATVMNRCQPVQPRAW